MADKSIQLLLNGATAELGDVDKISLKVSYSLEEPENFERKQSSNAFGITLPATLTNDKIFNTFHNPAIEDLTPGQSHRSNMPAEVYINGSNLVIAGKALLEEASHTDKPDDYTANIWGGNGDWLLDMQNMTIWDNVSPHTHTFDIDTVEDSWNYDGTNEVNDYVYAPVRYRQPFGDNDDTVTIYHLRPSISIYWLLYRAFRAVGYKIESEFFDTPYFRKLVMPWTWGDFYDIEAEVLKIVGFKACGRLPAIYPPVGAGSDNEVVTNAEFTGSTVWTHYGEPDMSFYYMIANTGGTFGVGEHPVKSYTGEGSNHHPVDSSDNIDYKWRMDNEFPPYGRDELNTYSFDESTGVMSWSYAPPTSLPYLSNNITANFAFNVLHWQFAGSGSACGLLLRVVKVATADTVDVPIPSAGVNPLGVPTVVNFSVSGIAVGDVVTFQLIWNVAGLGSGGASLRLCQASYMNTGGETWAPRFSSLELTGLQVELGGSVNLKWYDVFKKYRTLDFIGGVVDCFDLEVQTDNVNRTVCFEPMFETKLDNSDEPTITPGYFKTDKIFDWSQKQDLMKHNVMQLFSNHEQQVDFTFKQDGADGGQNIWAARYHGVYLNGIIGGRVNTPRYMNNAVGIVAGVPGSSRYMFPDRFLQGNRQKVNRFFSATMHCNYQQWKHITGIPTQLIAIIPENINDTSASAVSQVFEPKIAYYKGIMSDAGTHVGGWKFETIPGDPTSVAELSNLPFMFSVNYSLDVSGNDGRNDPVLSYSDQLINGNVVQGLMKRFFLKRLAIMRNGQLYKPWVNLTLRDIANWKHRECIFLRQSMYALIGIDDYQPLVQDSSQCTMWRITPVTQADVNSCYPSTESVSTGPEILPVNDIRYATLILYTVDIPQVNA